MPSIETFHRHDAAVLWAATTTRDRYGEIVLDEARQIQVRWENGQQEMEDPQGQTITVQATVVVDEVIPVGSEMWQGELADWEEGLGTMRVVAIGSVPDLKGRFTRRVVGLRRARDNPRGQ